MDDRKALLEGLKIDRDRDAAAPPRWPLLALFSALFLGIGLGGGYLLFSADPAEDAAPRSRTDADASGAAAPVAPPAPTALLSASGYVTARRMATISAELTGRITEVLVEEGMRVEEGQVVARLDDALARVDLALAESQVQSSAATIIGIRANLAEAERVEQRARELRDSAFGSDADFTRAEALVLSLKADLARAEADLRISRSQTDRARERLSDHVIRAPFRGVVTDKNAQPGEIVAPGSAGGGFTRTGICTIVDMSSLEIEVDVNENFIGRVTPGQKVEARLDAYPDWLIPARVIAIIPTANRDKATVKVRIGLDAADSRILPDMGVNVAFLADRAE